MAEENKSHEYETKVGEESGAVETKDRGLFDFLGKKEEEKPQEEVIATDFEEKLQVSEPETKVEEEHKKKEEEEKKPTLSEKLHRSGSSSSSSSSDEEEGDDEEKKKKKKEKRSLKEKMKISGEKGEEKEHEDTSVPVEVVHTETPHEPEDKKGFLDKIKEKLPGHKKADEVPPPAPEHVSPEAAASHEGDAKEKKGLLEKIKEKLPGYHNTVLHMATYAKEASLVEKLLDELPGHHLDKLTRQNRVGNTVLHETATSNHTVALADKLLKRAPGLLGMRNHNGETALFRAARYGKTDMFNFLAAKVSGYDESGLQFYVQRSDKTTILHMAILSLHFDLAYQIALDYTHLIGQKDADGMTGLQLLSCNPSAFKLEPEEGFINLAKSYGSSVWREKVQKQKQLHRSAVELAKFLVRKDTSWELTYSSIDQSKPKIHKYGERGGQERQEVHLSNKILDKEESLGETPLILATKSGCVEIVEEILKAYPQAVEHIDDDGRNVLHVAIKYRQLNIFKLVTRMEVPMKRLGRKIDKDGNSILHNVGKKSKDVVSDEKMEGPAFLLQEELLWFEVFRLFTFTFLLCIPIIHIIHRQAKYFLTVILILNPEAVGVDVL